MSFTDKCIIGLIFVVAVFAGLLIWQNHKINKQSDDYDAFKTALSAEVHKSVDKYGDTITSVKSAVFADLQPMKDAIAELNARGANIKSVIDRNTQSLVLLDERVGGTLTGKTNITGMDTVKSKIPGRPDTIKVYYPIYAFNDSNKYYHIFGTVKHDSYKITPLFFDSSEIKSQFVSHGLFKKGELQVQSLSKSPYVQTTGLKSIVLQKSPAPVMKYVYILVGVAIGAYGGSHIHFK